MHKTRKIPFSVLVERLSAQVGAPLGMNHLAVLMHGWRKKYPGQAPEFHTLRMRKVKDGFPWLSYSEALLLEQYAGYKLV